MPYSVPNQRMVSIHRERPTSDFLGIKNENWQAAARDLDPYALELYLYFAANADGYSIAFSPAAVYAAVGMARSTARDQFKKLMDKGYVVQHNGNGFDFYEISQTRAAPIQKNTAAGSSNSEAAGDFCKQSAVPKSEGACIEINNTASSTPKLINNSGSAYKNGNPAEKKEFIF